MLMLMHFMLKDGEFAIPIKAVLPVFSVSAPELLNVKTCAVKDETQLNFTVYNNR